MPAFQMLEPAPSFGGQLGAALGGGISQGLGSAVSQHLQKKQNKSQLKGLAPIFKEMGLPDEGINQLINSGLDPKIVSSLAGQLGQQQAKFKAQEQKVQAEQQEKQTKKENLLSTLDQIEKRLPYVGTTKIPGYKSFLGGGPLPLNREAVEQRNYIHTAALTLEGYLRDAVTKGTLPVKTFQELLKRLPDPELSERENKGRINALRDVINGSEGARERTPLKKVTQGTKLSDNVAQDILEKAGGDPQKARDLAKQLGYSWD